MKRVIDASAAGLGLLVLSPLLVVITLVVWLSDRRSPFYVSRRCGRDGEPFQMIKFRTMIAGAHRSGVASTAATDSRITRVGRVLRDYKLDEIPQLFNVLVGEMSLVGPRPNIPRAIDMYSDEERDLLAVRPGITDLASIVFADEGSILAGRDDPDLAYEQLIRPGKSQLGLFYAKRGTPGLDIKIVVLTLVSVLSRQRALRGVAAVLADMGAPPDLVELAGRTRALSPTPPPGLDAVVTTLAPIRR